MSETPRDGDSGGTAPAGAGALLKAARERQGVHLAVLAASLKVTPHKLELLEADRHGELPDPSFARALALSVCRSLKIDPEPVLTRLPRQGEQVLDGAMRSLNQPFRDGGGGDSGEWPRWLSGPVIGAALLAAAAVLVYLLPVGFWSSLRPDRSATPGAPVTSDATGASAPAGIADAARVPAQAGAASQAVPATQAGVQAAPASAAIDTVFLAPADPASAAAAGSLLRVRARGESWVEVRDRNGQVLMSRTLAAGESVGLDGVPPFKLTVGNAAATEVLFRGQPVDIATRDNIARLELK